MRKTDIKRPNKVSRTLLAYLYCKRSSAPYSEGAARFRTNETFIEKADAIYHKAGEKVFMDIVENGYFQYEDIKLKTIHGIYMFFVTVSEKETVVSKNGNNQ